MGRLACGTAGDVNALFYWRGVWHLMSQWEMEVPNTYGPTPDTITAVGWGHSVSTDLLTFERIAPALVPGPPSTTMEGCVYTYMRPAIPGFKVLADRGAVELMRQPWCTMAVQTCVALYFVSSVQFSSGNISFFDHHVQSLGNTWSC